MSTTRWTEVGGLFEAAIMQPRNDREAFVKKHASETWLQNEVMSLLEAHYSDGPLSRGDEPARPLHEQRVGDYYLVDLLGVGGMGAVYLAERRGEGFVQRVALKLIRAGYADPRLDERMAEERRILARLEHPGVARFIDGGTTESGQSYIAMELVQGTSIVEYCRVNGVSFPGRIELFLNVCEAVQAAHEIRIVHGDLKPENISVDLNGRPRLLDFGISELVDHQSGSSHRTVPWLTPAYASPEQFLGQRLTPGDDIYALGVILYELLAGRRPYETDALSPAELQRVICVDPPRRPSEVARSPRDRRLLRGDLETVMAKALAKECNKRYRTVQALADDLRRYQSRLPILAQRDSLAYRARKFTSRHRVAVATTALTILSLAGAASVSIVQARQAERERHRAVVALEDAETVSSFLVSLFESNERTQAANDSLVVRAIADRGLIRIGSLGDKPLLQARLLEAIGNVLMNLEDMDRGRELLERAVALRKRVQGARHMDVAGPLRSLSRASRYQARYLESERLLKEALSIQRESLGPRHTAVAATMTDLAHLLPYLNRERESDSIYREVLAMTRSIHGMEHPAVVRAMLRVGLAMSRVGEIAASESTYRAALALSRKLSGDDSRETAIATVPLADVLARVPSSLAESEALYRRAIEIFELHDGRRSQDLVHPISNLGMLLTRLGRPVEAESLLRRSLEIRRRRYGSEHTGIAAPEEELGTALHYQGRYRESDSLRAHAVELRKRMYGPGHPTVGSSLAFWAELLTERGDYREAEAMVRESLRLRRAAFGPRGLLTVLSEAQLAELLMHRGQYAEAERLLARTLDVLLETMSPAHHDVQETYRRLARLYERMGNRSRMLYYRTLASSRGS